MVYVEQHKKLDWSSFSSNSASNSCWIVSRAEMFEQEWREVPKTEENPG